MQKHVNLVDLVKSFPKNIFLQNLASIQKRTSSLKFAHLAEKSENGSISNHSTKVGNRPSTTANAGRRGQIASRESAGSSGVGPNRPVTTDGEVNPRHGNRTSPAGPWVRGITNELLPSRGTCLPDLVGDKAEAPRGRDIAEDPIGWAKWQGRQTAGQTNFATG